ncbi:hypothetical protein [Mesorhizobium japonicum]
MAQVQMQAHASPRFFALIDHWLPRNVLMTLNTIRPAINLGL